MSSTSFATLQDSLSRAIAACGASESHGTLCGALSVGADEDGTWLEHVLGEDATPGAAQEECRRLLTELRDTTRRELDGGALEFTPLLPDDSDGLQERTAALADWCQGYLYGLGLGGERLQLERLADEAGEVLRDVGEIARAGLEAGEDSEEDENAYAEIVEYLRVGVQLVYEELRPRSASHAPPGSLH